MQIIADVLECHPWRSTRSHFYSFLNPTTEDASSSACADLLMQLAARWRWPGNFSAIWAST